MSNYRIGLAAITRPADGRLVGFRTPAVPGRRVSIGASSEGPGVAGAIALAGLALGAVVLFRRNARPTVGGPDTSDIAAKLRLRGRDPYKYGL